MRPRSLAAASRNDPFGGWFLRLGGADMAGKPGMGPQARRCRYRSVMRLMFGSPTSLAISLPTASADAMSGCTVAAFVIAVIEHFCGVGTVASDSRAFLERFPVK